MMQWQPIDTAPKDRLILLFWPATGGMSIRIACGKWDHDEYARRPKPYWTSDRKFIGVREHRDRPPIAWAIEHEGDPVDLPPLVAKSLKVGRMSDE